MCLGDLIFCSFWEFEIAVNDAVLVCDCEILVTGRARPALFFEQEAEVGHVEVFEWREGKLVRRAKKTVRYTWTRFFIFISLGGISDPF